MTAINIWHAKRTTPVSHGRIEPMRREDEIFWRLRAERKKEKRDGR